MNADAVEASREGASRALLVFTHPPDRAAHPYELPEIIAVPVERGLPKYLDWVVRETTP